MSLTRLSVIGDEVFEPDPDGDLVPSGGPSGGSLGRYPLGQAAPEGARLREYLERTARGPAAGPVVVLVHGFWYDPADPVHSDRTQRTDNPHALIYHFSADPGHGRRTASWPLGLGFARDDRGRSGLAVAFAWDSKPDLLKRGAVGDAARRSAVRDVPLPELVGAVTRLVAIAPEFRVPSGVIDLGPDLAALVLRPPRDALAALLGRIGEALTDLDDAYARPVLDAVAPALPGFYKQAYNRAETAAGVLVHTIRAAAGAVPPDRPIDLFCHSLGSRVVVQALTQMADHERGLLRRVGRVILVGAAEYTEEARAMLAAAGPDAPSCYNFMGGRDRVLTHLAGRYHPVRPELHSRAVGHYGLEVKEVEPRWIDLQLDTGLAGIGRPVHRLNDWLRRRGLPEARFGAPVPKAPLTVAGAAALGILNHWYYFDAGNMALYAAILRDRAAWEIDRLRRENIPENEPGPEATGG